MVHGLSIPLGKLGFHLPRTISNAFDTSLSTPGNDEPELPIDGLRIRHPHRMEDDPRRRSGEEPPTPVFRVGRSVVADREERDREI